MTQTPTGRTRGGLQRVRTRIGCPAGQGTVEYVALILLVAGFGAPVVALDRAPPRTLLVSDAAVLGLLRLRPDGHETMGAEQADVGRQFEDPPIGDFLAVPDLHQG